MFWPIDNATAGDLGTPQKMTLYEVHGKLGMG